MPFIPAVNTAQVTLQFAQPDGTPAENVIYGLASGPFGGDDLELIANITAGWWDTGDGTHSLKSKTAHNASLVSITVRDMTVESGDVYVWSVGEAGTNGDGSIPLGLTWALTLRSGLAGRSQRGRVFIVCPGSDILSATVINGIDPTVGAQWVSVWSSLLTTWSGLDLTDSKTFGWVIRSTRTNNAPRDTSQLTPVTAVGYHNLLLDFQRRRAPAHNRHH